MEIGENWNRSIWMDMLDHGQTAHRIEAPVLEWQRSWLGQIMADEMKAPLPRQPFPEAGAMESLETDLLFECGLDQELRVCPASGIENPARPGCVHVEHPAGQIPPLTGQERLQQSVASCRPLFLPQIQRIQIDASTRFGGYKNPPISPNWQIVRGDLRD